MAKRTWRDLSSGRRRTVIALGAVQVAMAAAAWADLAKRAPSEVTASKPVWAAIIAVNFVGPLAYLRWGRRERDMARP
ncbi:PLDc N-terminal domain-containing protein [Actinokineospora fastidiosa]|uniref:Cardiolipin synthase N-terminal domain-containing protein n=1 Tax=Actinokineospora fastidiosa TaxID=1816 RepID=A0A918GM74_9PSEU|nr:PLDc N-terminal domain-containing protein [Actinokineospora fastidiosa]GGS44914.1 hypothetical protein GCM10010171_44760 [Actinokineospora fastidiosa]